MNTNIELLLTPKFFNKLPAGKISIDNEVQEFVLSEPTTFKFQIDKPVDSNIILTVEYLNKTMEDCQGTRDTAIIIDQIWLNGYTSPQILWKGIYYPTYPDYYKTQNPNLKAELPSVTYMGWNGKWQLNLTVPIFTWIHKAENLGWIYD